MGFDDSLSFLEKSFMGSSDSYDYSEVVLVGAPMDFTSSYRPGSRFGPENQECFHCNRRIQRLS